MKSGAAPLPVVFFILSLSLVIALAVVPYTLACLFLCLTQDIRT